MKKWIADCDKKHTAKNKDQPNCNPKRSGMRLPTRLIYVGSVGKATKIHLDCSDTRDPGLKYIALSHRWGYPRDDDEWTDSDGKAKNFCTTNDNLVEFMDPQLGIDFAAMPKTFRDAIEVTRGLGLEYLWIDSLCIIQNQSDNADFNAESRRMRDVYNGAYCTIASTGADGTTDGFLNKKEDRACVRIETTRKVLDGKTPDSIDDKPCTVYVCDAIDDFKRDVDGSDMATRGWILQERALSRRTLHFAKNQVYWECGAGVCCETLTRLFNRRATFMSDPDFPSQAGKYLKGMKIKFYESLYQHYSSLNFSVMANRAVAMDGLESKILTTFLTKGAYGIMDGEFLHRSFLWKRQEPLPEGAMHQIPFRKNDPTPPSWSWMAVSGKITYLPVDFDTVDWDTYHVLSPFRNTVDMLGVVADSQLVPIKAVARDINWKTVSSKAETLFLDREPVPRGIPGLKCVVMGTKKERPRAGGGRLDDSTFRFPVLLVAPKDLPAGYSGTPLYERVGVGKLEDHQMEAEPLEKQWVHIS
ncbi:heterokaryon incompatibility protein-domain-containing protein [Bisporella sp. PMI_857]|nr:heterokaryon incompatibility protein-domain-containing protein [Bisporella sp. PMI_857]